ncbi:MAG TPA: hypothetical protein VNJ54_01325 [Plantibacter sp.]|uniref:hypothetical protein n=1 Tax=Plantibacter sp. TaxID=1871045 RepID=UPI002C072783|nr:hypothetical protein [Plantibacter sp.]
MQHRFAELLPRQRTPSSAHCLECATQLEEWEGQAGPRTYLFTAREIAHALREVARGLSYRRAAEEARLVGRRVRGAQPRPVPGLHRPRWRQQKRSAAADGQLVANWMDVFAPVVLTGELPTYWPERIAVDSAEFRIAGGNKAGMSFNVFIAVGYEPGDTKGRLWRMEAFPRRTAADWGEFFGRLTGTPKLIVSDMDTAIRNAAAASFPRGSAPAPEIRICEHHLKGAIRRALSPIAGNPQHPVLLALERALLSAHDWAGFEQLVRQTHSPQTPLLTMINWLNRYSSLVEQQVQTRPYPGPFSTGAAEAFGKEISARFDRRSYVLSNRRRTNLLLDLFTLDLTNRVDERLWAEKLRHTLALRDGFAPHQRQHDDPAGRSSLVA